VADVGVFDVIWEVGACWFKGLLTLDDFEKGAGAAVLLSWSEALALSLFSMIIGMGLSSDALRAVDDCDDAGFLLPGSGVIDRENHLPPPLLGGVAAKNAADKELDAAGPADRLRHVAELSSLRGTFVTGFEGGGGGVRVLENDHDFLLGVSESWEPTLA